MPTVIDSLVVTLGLDASKFNEEQKKALDQLRQLGEGAQKHVKPATKGVEDMVGAFKELQGRLLAIGALIATGLGFNRLVQDITKTNVELGNLSRTLGMTAQELSAWEKIGPSVGASAQEMAAGLAAINKEIQQLHYYGKSDLGATLAQLGMKPMDITEKPDQFAKRLSEFYQQYPDKKGLQYLLQSKGLPQGFINSLALGPEELEKQLAKNRKLAPKDSEIDQFRKLNEAFNDMVNVIGRLTTLAIVPFIGKMTELLNLLTDWITKHVIESRGSMANVDTGQGPAAVAGGALMSKPLPMRAWDWLRNKWSGGDSPSQEGSGDASSPSAPRGATPSAPGSAPGGAARSLPGQVGPGPSQPAAPAAPGEFQDRWRGLGPNAAAPVHRVAPVGASLGPSGSSGGEARSPAAAARGPSNDQASRPDYLHGTGSMTGFGEFKWGSGSGRHASIPYGDYPVTPGTIGPWGRAHGAVGINNNKIWDAKLGRYRAGIEIHASSSSDLDRLYTQGCFAVPAAQWPAFKSHLLGEIHRNGPMYLHVGPNGATLDHISKSTASVRDAAKRGGLGGASIIDLSTARRRLQGGPGSGSPTTNNNTNSNTSINNMNVTVPPGADASAYGDGIARRLADYNNVQNSITGLV